jgi:beta-lactamase regulating signal transducer with metallopeptidase domain
MSDLIVTFLNSAGHTAVLAAVRMTLQVAALVAVLLALDRVLRDRTRAALRYGLWMLVTVKLLLPTDLLSPTALAYWIAPQFASPIPAFRFSIPADRGGTAGWLAPAPAEAVSTQFTPTSPSLEPQAGILAVWAAGTLALAVWVALRNRRVTRLCLTAETAPDDLVRLLSETAGTLGLGRVPELRLSRTPHSPALCGLLRPVVLLPRALVGQIDREALRNVFLHELIHLRRRDPWFNTLQVAVQVGWWWNPLVWFANARIRALREGAVDEAVMLEADGADYPSTLVAVARHCCAPSSLALAFLGILESPGRLELRVRRLLERPLPRTARLGISGWAGLLLLAATVLPMGFARRIETVASPGSSPRPATPEVRPDVPGTATKAGLPPSETHEVLRTRMFRLDPRAIANALGEAFGTQLAPNDTGAVFGALVQHFQRLGLPFSASVQWVPETSDTPSRGRPGLFLNGQGTLYVRATQADLKSVEKALEVLSLRPAQIELETRWIDAGLDRVPQFASVASGSGSQTILTAAQTRVLLDALHVLDNVDILTGPKVTTLSGREAEVSVQNSKTVVTGKSPATNGIPESIQSIQLLTGPRIRLEATTDPIQTNAITLNAAAEVVEFLGYLDNPAHAPSPLIRTNHATAIARIWDGQSVFLSLGLITNTVFTKDSVPILGDMPLIGRLFRSESSNSVVRHRLVLITPTLIDPVGSRVNDPAHLPFDPDTFPTAGPAK